MTVSVLRIHSPAGEIRPEPGGRRSSVDRWNDISSMIKAVLDEYSLKMPKSQSRQRCCLFGRAKTPDLIQVLRILVVTAQSIDDCRYLN